MLYYYQSSNPCICNPSSPNDPLCPDDCNCLKICSIAINGLSDDAVGPCAATGTLDISSSETYGHDFCACGVNPVKWAIEWYDPLGFVTASISNAGVLTWVTKGGETAGQYFCITICVSCGNLKVYANILVGIKDLCAGCIGIDCNDCDPCTGLTEVTLINASIQAGETSSNNSISGS